MTTKALHDSSEETDRELAAVRSEIETADRDLVAAAARRVRLGRREADLRRQIQRPAVDFAYERSVLEGVRDWSSSLGLDPVVAEDLVSRVFEASLELQEADDLRHAGTGAGFGVLFTTFVTLLLVPALYMINEDVLWIGRQLLSFIVTEPQPDVRREPK